MENSGHINRPNEVEVRAYNGVGLWPLISKGQRSNLSALRRKNGSESPAWYVGSEEATAVLRRGAEVELKPGAHLRFWAGTDGDCS